MAILSVLTCMLCDWTLMRLTWQKGHFMYACEWSGTRMDTYIGSERVYLMALKMTDWACIVHWVFTQFIINMHMMHNLIWLIELPGGCPESLLQNDLYHWNKYAWMSPVCYVDATFCYVFIDLLCEKLMLSTFLDTVCCTDTIDVHQYVMYIIVHYHLN